MKKIILKTLALIIIYLIFRTISNTWISGAWAGILGMGLSQCIDEHFDIKESGIIEYKYGQFGINCLGMFWNIHPTKLEVIGNIYENPELLKEEIC